jgi:hypothetical protein
MVIEYGVKVEFYPDIDDLAESSDEEEIENNTNYRDERLIAEGEFASRMEEIISETEDVLEELNKDAEADTNYRLKNDGEDCILEWAGENPYFYCYIYEDEKDIEVGKEIRVSIEKAVSKVYPELEVKQSLIEEY